MANLRLILGGDFVPPADRYVEPPEQQLMDAIRAAGLEAPDKIYLDGVIHRFNTGVGNKRDKTGWYIGFGDEPQAARFGCWRSDIEGSWVADIGRTITPAEQMAHARRMAEAREKRDAEREKSREVVANVALDIWNNAATATVDHPYIKRKGIQPHGSRVTGDGRLIVPLYDYVDGALELTSVQYIKDDGSKLYHSGGKTGGCFWTVGSIANQSTFYVAEGFATAATIHEVTGSPCFVSYSASNLTSVVEKIRTMAGNEISIVVVADNDESGVGQRNAEQAAAKHGARVVTPPILGDANDYYMGGGDLAALLDPKVDDGWLVAADDFCAQPAPIKWLVKGWLQENALIMIHGPSGGGKTFTVLDMMLNVAAGTGSWQGLRAKPANVVYLAGEGHHGLRSRIAGWKQHNNITQPINMWLSRDGCDLNTREGYQRVAESIRSLGKTPEMIVVDTLHRFMHGDENSAQDTKTMLDACAGLMSEFGCSVVLVHHTGVSDEAQHRARGSSAWRGALDIEISIRPGKDNQPIEVSQKKSKDAEMADPLYFDLTSINIEGWFDEEGEPVTTAVLQPADAPPKPAKRDSAFDRKRKEFESAWLSANAEVDGRGRPYISRSALLNYLTSNELYTESTANKEMQPSRSGGMINLLTINRIIEPESHGWSVINTEIGASLLLRRNE